MSLLHLVHQSVVIKFGECAKSQYNPEASYAFRLVGVDGMGFLQIQDQAPGTEPGTTETTGEPFWINKDLIREIHVVDLATAKGIVFTGKIAKPVAVEAAPEPKIETAPREVSPKPAKAKIPAKKSVLKQKPVFN